MYRHSRLIAALTDAHMSGLIFNERYRNAVLNRGQQLLNDYDERVLRGEPVWVLEEANRKITDMVREASDKVLSLVLKNASEHMKIRYHRGDNWKIRECGLGFDLSRSYVIRDEKTVISDYKSRFRSFAKPIRCPLFVIFHKESGTRSESLPRGEKLVGKGLDGLTYVEFRYIISDG